MGPRISRNSGRSTTSLDPVRFSWLELSVAPGMVTAV